MDFFNDFIRNLKGTEPFWEDKDYLIKNLGDHAKNGNLPPILWLAGWHDFFLNQTLEDFMNSQINQDTKLYVLGMAHWDIYKYYGKLLREIFSFVREHAAPMAKGSYLVSYLILLYLILSYLIVSYLIVSYLIVSYRILSYLILSYLILSHLILSHLILPHCIVSHLILPHCILSQRIHKCT